MTDAILAAAQWPGATLLLERAGWTLVHFLWQGAAVAAALSLFFLLMRHASAPARYRLACGAMLAMTVAPPITFWLLGMTGDLRGHPISTVATTQDGAAPIAVPSATIGQATGASLTVDAHDSRLGRVVAAWAVGVVLLSLWRIAGWANLRRLLRDVDDDIPAAWGEGLERLAARLGVTRPVRLVRASWVAVPSIVGVFRPVVLFPLGAITGLTPGQFEALLAHELAHVRRSDYVVNLAQVVVETLLFYHPAVWWVSARIREEREHCCDDLAADACGDRVQYADALAAMESLRSLPPGVALAAKGGRGTLLSRVRRVLGGGPSSCDRRSLMAAVVACVAVPLVAVGLVVAAGDRADQPAPKDAPAAGAAVGDRIDWNAVAASEVEPADLDPAANPAEHKIVVDEMLNVTLTDFEPGHQTVTSKRVTADGTIKLSALPEGVRAAGRTTVEVEKAIDDAYRAADPNRAKPVRSAVTVTEARLGVVTVTGGVKLQGQYRIPRADFRLFDVLVTAEGNRVPTDVDEIHVFRATPKPRKIQVPVDRLLRKDPEVQLVLRAGDVVIVRGGPLLARLEVGAKGHLRFRNVPSTWDLLPGVLEKVPQVERARMQIVVQVVSNEVTVRDYDDAIRHASAIAETNGLRPITTAPPIQLFPKDIEPPAEELIGEYYIGGDVARPGAYSVVKRVITLRAAVTAAGIPIDSLAGAKLRIVRRTTDGEQIIERDAEPLMKDGSGNLPMRPEDQVMLIRAKGS